MQVTALLVSSADVSVGCYSQFNESEIEYNTFNVLIVIYIIRREVLNLSKEAASDLQKYLNLTLLTVCRLWLIL